MIFLSDSQGTITASIPSPINQGSIGVNEIVLLAPFPSTCVVYVGYTLPNGMIMYPQHVGPQTDGIAPENVLTPQEIFADKIKTEDGKYLNVWKTKLTRAVTQYTGNLKVQFYIVSSQGEVLTTSLSVIAIEKGTPYLSPTITSGDINTIAQYTALAEQAADRADEAAARAEYYLKSQWDYVFDSDNFNSITSADLDGCSVLITGVIARGVQLDLDADLIYFHNCNITGYIIANKVIGAHASFIPGTDTAPINELKLEDCSYVQNCTGIIFCEECENVSNSEIIGAYDCTNVNNVRIVPRNVSGVNVKDNFFTLDTCKNVSNVYTRVGDTVTYIDCDYVSGETAQGYYPTSDNGKVRVITADGSYQAIEVYEKDDVYNKSETVEIINNDFKTFAKGVQEAVVCRDYADVVNTLNSMPYYGYIDGQTEYYEEYDYGYNPGQSIYVKTRDVPDLWISAVVTENDIPQYQAYTYTTDEAFISALIANNDLQIGYYHLSILETEKPNLGNYYTKLESDDRYLKIPTVDKNYNVVPYVKPDGTEGRDTVSNNPIVNAIVKRTPNKQIRLPNQLDTEPLEDEAISRRYFEANKGGSGGDSSKLYQHTVLIRYGQDYDEDWADYLRVPIEGHVTICNDDPTPFTDAIKVLRQVRSFTSLAQGGFENRLYLAVFDGVWGEYCDFKLLNLQDLSSTSSYDYLYVKASDIEIYDDVEEVQNA